MHGRPFRITDLCQRGRRHAISGDLEAGIGIACGMRRHDLHHHFCRLSDHEGQIAGDHPDGVRAVLRIWMVEGRHGTASHGSCPCTRLGPSPTYPDLVGYVAGLRRAVSR